MRAHIGTQPRVIHNVQSELLRRRKAPSTADIITALGFLARVHALMALQMVLALETLSAAHEETLKGFLARMDLLMLNETRTLRKRLLTDLATERTLSRVDADVRLEIALLLKRLLTDRTLKRSLIGVRADVFAQMRLIRCAVATAAVTTFVRPFLLLSVRARRSG